MGFVNGKYLPERPAGERTALKCPLAEAASVAAAHQLELVPLWPCGTEVRGLDATLPVPPALAGALEAVMAASGFILLRGQPTLSGDQQCALSEAFGAGQLHSTHSVHPESPNRDVFRLSNHPAHGFNSVGPEWHNDGAFCRRVFGHVVYHIVESSQDGDTRFAHLGIAHDLMPPARRARLARCGSVNSNGGVVHPLIHKHPVSDRASLFLHLGMTGAVLEAEDGAVRGWSAEEMDGLFGEYDELLSREQVSYSHKWQQGDIIIIDNLAVAHKATPGAHQQASGLRILHRTTVAGEHDLDPPGLPITADLSGPCPYGPDCVWVEGYVGFRWGAWHSRTVPH